MSDWFGANDLGWLAFGLIFLVSEIKGIYNKEHENTLSGIFRYVFGFSKRSPWYRNRLRQGAFLALIAWFTGHIALGW